MPGMWGEPLLSGFSRLWFDAPFLFPVLFFCLVLLLFLSWHFSANGPFPWLAGGWSFRTFSNSSKRQNNNRITVIDLGLDFSGITDWRWILWNPVYDAFIPFFLFLSFFFLFFFFFFSLSFPSSPASFSWIGCRAGWRAKFLMRVDVNWVRF